MARVKVRHGSEGPSHDPYSYTEVTFWPTDPSAEPITHHAGLGSWVRVGRRIFRDGERCVVVGQMTVTHTHLSSEQLFEQMTGLSVRRAQEIPDRLLARYMRTLSPEERWQVLECIEADQSLLRWAM